MLKAIEGGWNGKVDTNEWGGSVPHDAVCIAVLDPLFWQCLGKAMKWNMTDVFPEGRQTQWSYVGDMYARTILVFENTPAFHWHRLIDFLAVGGTVEGYFDAINPLYGVDESKNES